MIKVIHQTWKNKNPPEDIFRPEWIRSWTLKNPEWEYRLWTDEEIFDFVMLEFPEFFPIWCSYPKHIMRVDAWRYLMLKRQGGLYVDLDIAALLPLDSWIEGFPYFSCADQGDGHLSNALMWASQPDMAFFEDIVAALVVCAYEPNPLDATGPRFLHRYASSRMGVVSQISTERLFPIIVWDHGKLPEARTTSLELLSQKYCDSYTISFWTGSWTEEPNTLIAQPISLDPNMGPRHSDFFIAVIVSTGAQELCQEHERYYNDFEELFVNYWRPNASEESLCDESETWIRSDGSNLVSVLKSFLNSDKKWAFVCSEATYFVPARLALLIQSGADFVANESLLVQEVPNRNAGYLISRHLAQSLIAYKTVLTEYDLALYLSEQEVHVEITPLLRHERFRYPTHGNQIVSTALSDPRQFAVIPQVLDSKKTQIIHCAHQQWRGPLEFLENGGCIRPATGCCGLWQPLSRCHRKIDWFEWPQEIMLSVGEGLGFLVHAEDAATLFP